MQGLLMAAQGKTQQRVSVTDLFPAVASLSISILLLLLLWSDQQVRVLWWRRHA
jgi:hypothetical protein